jgi:hypothetical protein
MAMFETKTIEARDSGVNTVCAGRTRGDRISTARWVLACAGAAACCLFADPSAAAVVTLQSVDEGEYISSTTGTEFSGNYRATIDTGGFNWRNFLVFDLVGISGTVTSASLFIPGFGTTIIAPSPVTYALHAVATSPAILLAGGDGATNIYADLADGTLYGSAVIQNPADNSGSALMPDVTVSLAGALADINGGLGAFLAIGGHVAAPTTPSVVLWRGLNTSNAAFKPTLILEVGEVPLPPGVLLLLAGVGALALGVRRPRSA